MSIRAKVISIVAAASLVAGAGLAVATPAQAKNHVKGSTQISIDAGIIAALASVGVSLGAAEGARMKGNRLTFPINGAGDGYISHKGQLQFKRDSGTTPANNPILGWPTDVPLTTAVISFDVPGFGETSLFTVTNLKAGKTKVKINKKKKTRMSTTIYRGDLTVDAEQAGLINALAGSNLLQAGTPLGKTVTKLVVTAKCKNKACTR